DITKFTDVEAFIIDSQPDIIVNAAAYTAVDKAERESQIAEKTNTLGPKYLAIAAKKIGAKFYHISTDYVFDGTSLEPYLETDLTSPLGVYGKTKLLGEQEILAVYRDKSTIIRTAWVFSEYGHNFVKTILRLANERDELKIVNDQFGCPTYAGDL